MTLNSMTGFAATNGEVEGIDWRWELRSLNGRGLDLRVRLPSGFEELEPIARALVSKKLARGSVQIGLHTRRPDDSVLPRVNQKILTEVIEIARRLESDHDIRPASVHGLLSLRGVLDFAEPEADESGRQAILASITAGMEKAFELLAVERAREGEELQGHLIAQVDEIERLSGAIAVLPARDPAIHFEKVKAQIERLLGDHADFSMERLHQEGALLATKADIREELDRLQSHIEAARELVALEEPVGRRLDFLAQEFNREANTICSKSGDIETTRMGLELKAVIDQFKEQVQNVE